jgi:sugar (pentulose or hexulose) kinase
VLEKEAGCKGAMISTAVALGIFSTFDDAIETTVESGKKFIPNMDRHKEYIELLSIFQSTYTAMFPSWQQMFDFSESRKKSRWE